MLEPISQGKSSDDVMNQIVKNIQNGTFRPRDALPTERKLAEMLGVSRPVVREGLKSLKLLGVVSTVHGGGNYVADHLDTCLIRPLSILFSLNNSNVLQSQQLRAALECQATALAARNCTELNAASLRLILAQLDAASDMQNLNRLDRTLHLTIAKIAENPLIYSVLSASGLLTDTIVAKIRTGIQEEPDSFQEIDSQHRAIVDAVASHDAAGAERAMHIHMASIEQYIRRLHLDSAQSDSDPEE